jgi:hypothetical protein
MSDEEQERHPIESCTTSEIALSTSQTAPKRSTRSSLKDKSNHLPESSPILVCEDPKTTKSMDDESVVINRRRKFPCPLSSRMINLFGRPPHSSGRVPCGSILVVGPSLVTHLRRYHDIPCRIGRLLVKTHRENLIKMISSRNTTVTLPGSF